MLLGMTAISPPRLFTTPKRTVNDHAGVEESAPHISTSEVATEPPYFSLYMSSIIAVSLIFLVGVAIPAAMVYDATTGWALGAFCAFWGGPSFGVMTGSARVSAWLEENEGH